MRNRNSNLNHIVLLSADAFNPLPHMPILGSSSSTANKDMMSKYGKMGIQLSDLVENIVGEKKLLIMSNFFFPTVFSKAVCCWCIKMSIYRVKG